jgi:hypothetical protein
MRPLATLVFALAGLGLAAVGFELGTSWPYHAGQLLGWTGFVISVLAAIRQYREQLPFTYDFSETAWKPSGDEFVLGIPDSEHKKGRTPAGIIVYWPTDSGVHQEVMCGRDVTSSGPVVITVSKTSGPFSGRVVIK